MKRVEILMSTYCGEKYLREQLDSMLAQDCEECGIAKLHVLVRDDGSKDDTQKILEEYAASYPDKIRWYQGENIGVIKSFFELLKEADEQADFYAFADQDDYWMPDKIRAGIKAIEGMGENGTPRLYCCRPKLVDENLKELDSRIKRPRVRPSFGNALVENIVTGCTVVMDAVLREMVKENQPEFTPMHDRWLYLVASCFGTVYYDETPHICYRQHGGNVVGNQVSRGKELLERLQLFRKKKNYISRQAVAFWKIYGKSNDSNRNKQTDNMQWRENMELLKKLLAGKRSLKARRDLIRSGKIYRQRKNDNRVFKCLLWFGIY